MCIAVPVEVLKIDGEEAVVRTKGVTKRVNIALISEVEVGDYVLLHSGCAIKKIDRQAAQETLDAFATLAQQEGVEE